MKAKYSEIFWNILKYFRNISENAETALSHAQQYC